MARYSRLESTEEKRNFRNAVIFTGLSILTLVILFVFGIPAVGRVAGFVSDLKNGGSPIKNNDKTPPPPPRFNTYNDFTNSEYFTISGTSEPGSILKLNLNGAVKESVVDKDGKFTYTDLKLIEGENKFWAVAVDAAGNPSQNSNEHTINYDVKPPVLTIENPVDGTNFFGSTQRQININGQSEPGSGVTINDRFVSVNGEGKFQYPITLNSGDNVLNIKTTDKAGNTSEKSITLIFSE